MVSGFGGEKRFDENEISAAFSFFGGNLRLIPLPTCQEMQYYKVGEIRAGTQRSLESLTGWKGSEDVLVSSVVLARDLGQIQIPGNPRVVPSTHTCNFKRHLVSTSFRFSSEQRPIRIRPKM